METIILKDRISASMTDDEFFWFCLENKDLRIERNSNLEIIIMSSVTTKSNYGSGAAFAQLYMWSIANGTGLAFDSPRQAHQTKKPGTNLYRAFRRNRT